MFISLSALITIFFLCHSIESSPHPDLNPALGKYQDLNQFFPLRETWYTLYRNYPWDPVFGGNATCIRDSQVGPEEQGVYPIISEFGNVAATNLQQQTSYCQVPAHAGWVRPNDPDSKNRKKRYQLTTLRKKFVISDKNPQDKNVRASLSNRMDGTLMHNATATFESSPGYTVNNILNIHPGEGINLKIYIAYAEVNKCGILRKTYVNDDACGLLVPESELGKDHTCCDFIFDLLCGTSQKYPIYNEDCPRHN